MKIIISTVLCVITSLLLNDFTAFAAGKAKTAPRAAAMRSKSIDCVFANPPFNLGKDYKNAFDDNVSKAAYLQWCRKWIGECARILKPGGAFFL